MKISIYFLLAFYCFASNAYANNYIGFISQYDTSLLKGTFSKVNYNKLVSEIASYGRVEFGPVGYAAVLTEQYHRYLKLSSIATDSQLVALTDHYSATVKVYAASMLYSRKYQGFEKIYTKLLKNTQWLRITSGCIVESKQISNWIYEMVNGQANWLK